MQRNYTTALRTALGNILSMALSKIAPRESSHERNLEEFFKEVEERKIDLKVIYDVGAYTGKWSDMVRNKLLSIVPKNEIQFILFEPNECHTESINGLGFRNHETLLSNRKKKVKFYSVQGTGDSYFREHHLLYQEHTAKTYQTATLDNLRVKDAYEYPQPDFIKIDTQGSELEVLQGSRKTLKNCKFILIELSLVSYNIGAPRIQEVVDYCLNIEFLPFRHIENHYANGVLVQIDILFINRSLLESKFNVQAKDEWMSTSQKKA